MNQGAFVGKREQPESISNGQQLKDIADYTDLKVLKEKYDNTKLDRISMIDCLYISDSSIKSIFEVENSTNFSSAIIRASNVEVEIPKFMIVPDNRENELCSFSDPMFKREFVNNSWRYLTYSEIRRLSSLRVIEMKDLFNSSHSIDFKE